LNQFARKRFAFPQIQPITTLRMYKTLVRKLSRVRNRERISDAGDA
jgi:hypothetical protein